MFHSLERCWWNAKLWWIKHGRNGFLTGIEQPSTYEHGNKYDGEPTDATNVRMSHYLINEQYFIPTVRYLDKYFRIKFSP